MNILAFIIAVLAVVVFTATHFGVPRRWATISLGLALLTIALIIQFVWQAYLFTAHGG